ncbi:MAG: DUF3047 domain-containing protein [Gammaproteobacteria bacterium]|nr:DUF3047 domain-containing protein [Gammaproteobacteria bacterium]
MIKNTVFWLSLLTAIILTVSRASEIVEVGRFSQSDTDGWAVKKFSGDTEYSLSLVDGRQVLLARSEKSASAYYRKIDVDLKKTPILNWSWRKERGISPGDELTKPGDDFLARIYVVKSGGLLVWRTRVINYVWSNQHKKQESWDNPFAGDKAKMLSQRDASDPEGVWFGERRNVVEDFAELLDMDIDSIDGVAIMTDSDNSGLSASALYGDIFFSAE